MHFAMRVAGAGVWDWNTQTGEAWWSAEMYELFGVPSGTRMCLECSLACVLEEDRDRVARVLDLAVLRRRNYRCEYRVRHPELGLRWMESHGRLDDESGTVPTHLLGFTIDITRRKQSEEELARHRDKLEHLVSERTEELRRSQEQMRVSDRMASIGTLAAGLGHDMNNVLLPVRANLNAARAAHGERAPDIVRRCVDQIQKGVDYLQHLADGLHFLTMDPEFPDGGRTDLASWWEQTGSLLCKAVPKHVRVDTNLAEEGARRLPAMAIAPHRLTQAMLNLIVNAGQAIPSLIERPRRGGLIRIEAEVEGNVTKGHPVVLLLRVRDNGGGMNEEVKKRAFEMFFTTKPRGLGTGLGLPLVARVVKNAGGTVEIDSKEGCGTTVTLRIPAITPSPAPPSTPMCAVISLRDRRVAGVVRQLFEAAGVETRDAVDPGDGCWWVIEPESTRPAAARRWVGASKERSRLRRLLVVGPCSAASRASWRKQNAILIERPDDFASLREAVGRAVAGT